MAVTNKDRISPWVWVALAVLFLLALAVVFVLPRVVEQYELPLTARVEQTTAPAPANAPSRPAVTNVSPFEEAQLARQRREAQDILAELLRKQSELEMLGVEQWAPDRFASALATAQEGDTFYRNGEFDAATQSYQQGDQALDALLNQVDDEFARAMEAGNAALAAVDSGTAREQFTLAATLDPTSEEADQGLRRAETLDEVRGLLDQGIALQQQGDLTGAQDLFEQAIALDPLHQEADGLLADNQQRQTDARFTAIMSEGFAHLENDEADAAIAAFERALQVRPGSEQAAEAIRQTREELTLDSIAQLRSQAETAEANEQWQQAIDLYTQALALDANLVFATEGKDYSERRLQLDVLLQTNLDEPLRLSDPAAHQEAIDVYRIASELAADLRADGVDPGERLEAQIEQTGQLLDMMQEQHPVTLVSDNATAVTIYQIGELGTFQQTSVMLRPGRYVAVGTRPGYRDVRQEFVVGFGQAPGTVTVNIQCNEQVAGT
ncbi:MAG TPA: hypothetical protein DEG76_04255 [Pseudohongiella sp.]|nr:hypothetical protein [Pseudohongiella sp.]|tara:strand:- start:795801 stop:797288 length:1488 start_codon:yes stop_codon:yes gene_type:complete